jgi:Flp pilus assembly protein CpaB
LAARLLIGFGVLLAGSAFTVVVLAATGAITLPWMKKKVQEPNHDGMVAVPVSARFIKSGDRITSDDLRDPKTGLPKVQWWPPEQVASNKMLVDLDDILGQVMAKDRSPNFAFTSADFYPKGTRPGPTAAVPFGKRSVAVPAEKLHGLLPGMKPGDRVDLVVTVVADPAKTADKNALTAGLDPFNKAHVKVIAHNATLIVPPPMPNKAKASEPMQKHQDVVLAMETDEVPLLESALATGARISLVARSGQPGNAESERGIHDVAPARPEPRAKPAPVESTTIELLHGGKKDAVHFPAQKGSGSAASGKGP